MLLNCLSRMLYSNNRIGTAGNFTVVNRLIRWGILKHADTGIISAMFRQGGVGVVLGNPEEDG